MERKSALIIVGILLFSVVGTALAQTDPRFRIENSTQTVFDVDVYGNAWINQTLVVQDIICSDGTCIDDAEIGDVAASKITGVPTAWGRGNNTAEVSAMINTTTLWVDYANRSGIADSATISRGNTTAEIMAPVMTAGYWNDTISHLIAYTNLTVCGTGQILKESGGAWTCAADATGGGDTHEAIYPLVNDTSTIALTDIFANTTGDTFTGNVIMDNANFTNANTNARIEFTSDGGIIIHLEA